MEQRRDDARVRPAHAVGDEGDRLGVLDEGLGGAEGEVLDRDKLATCEAATAATASKLSLSDQSPRVKALSTTLWPSSEKRTAVAMMGDDEASRV